ncbi:hypothetical protein EDB85DRAFT_2074057 [Lactarius pseudohatsudake]|nr:hypothetical protein EDB85DRAFT_2074057 [Lactarius pseudohatsudake]
MASLARRAAYIPRYRSSVLLSTQGTSLMTSVCFRRSLDTRRTFFRSGVTLPTGLNPRVGTIFLGLIGLGFISTMIGVYEFYSSFAIWPEEVRSDLRAGVKAKQQGNFALSRRLLTQAYETALSLPSEKFSPSPYLKLSGIAITLSEVLEEDGQPKKAYETYVNALEHLKQHWAVLTGEERLRAISMGQKLGEMADTYQLGDEEEERWLTWSVEEVLKLAKDNGSPRLGGKSEDSHLVLSDLELPKLAVPLYLHTISLLVPPVASPRKATKEELCQGAQLMSNLSELFMRSAPTSAALHQSEAWARQALSLLQKTQGNASQSDDIRVCEEALAVVLFNLGSLREMNGDPKSARQKFEQSLEQSKNLRWQEGMAQARNAIRRLDREQFDAPPHLPDPELGIVPKK